MCVGYCKMKRVWFVQQQPFEFMSLKAGLGIITAKELDDYEEHLYPHKPGTPRRLCPKIYTTRTRRMSGEYQVVRGSRFKAKPLDPPIHFKVEESYEIHFEIPLLMVGGSGVYPSFLDDGKYTFPELDLGIRNTTIKSLFRELKRLNKKVDNHTHFYVNKLEPIN